MIADGRAIAEDMYEALLKRRALFARGIKLGIVVGGASPVIESFVRIKTRAAARLNVEMMRVDLPENATTETAIEAVKKLASEVDSVIVQLPLPNTLDTDAVLGAIPPQKDVDALNPTIPEDQH